MGAWRSFIGADGALWHSWQLSAGGAWGTWNSLGAPSSSIQAQGDPFVAENADGRLEAFVGGSDGNLWHTWQVTPGGEWAVRRAQYAEQREPSLLPGQGRK